MQNTEEEGAGQLEVGVESSVRDLNILLELLANDAGRNVGRTQAQRVQEDPNERKQNVSEWVGEVIAHYKHYLSQAITTSRQTAISWSRFESWIKEEYLLDSGKRRMAKDVKSALREAVTAMAKTGHRMKRVAPEAVEVDIPGVDVDLQPSSSRQRTVYGYAKSHRGKQQVRSNLLKTVHLCDRDSDGDGSQKSSYYAVQRGNNNPQGCVVSWDGVSGACMLKVCKQNAEAGQHALCQVQAGDTQTMFLCDHLQAARSLHETENATRCCDGCVSEAQRFFGNEAGVLSQEHAGSVSQHAVEVGTIVGLRDTAVTALRAASPSSGSGDSEQLLEDSSGDDDAWCGVGVTPDGEKRGCTFDAAEWHSYRLIGPDVKYNSPTVFLDTILLIYDSSIISTIQQAHEVNIHIDLLRRVAK